jgi:ATP-dependent DNA helicase DinG
MSNQTETIDVIRAGDLLFPQKAVCRDYGLTPESFFGQDGLIASVKPDFKPRPGQQELSELILQAVDCQESVLAEAPTGFGKSLANLVPTVIAAVQQGKRIVISTETLTLQDQYVSKDLPMLQEACATIGVHFSFAVAKGKGNYVCRAKLDEDDEYMSSTEVQEWARRLDINQGDTGDLASVPFPFRQADWAAIACDDDCERKACLFYGEGRLGPTDCFSYEAARKFLDAEIVVANHTLVLLDLGQEIGSILGPYDILVIDEAHSFGDKAQDTWGISLKPRTVSRTMNLLNRMLGKVGVNTFEPGYMDRFRAMEDGVFQPFAPVVEKGNNVALKQIRPWIIQESKEAAEDLIEELRMLNRDLNDYIDQGETEPRTVVVRAAKEKLSKLIRELNSIYGDNINEEWKDNWLVFLEVARNARQELYGILNLKPIEVAPLMRQALFGLMHTVVMMSATMRVGKSFDYIRRELGVPMSALEYVGNSPFNYRENVTGYFPTDLPDPNEPDYLPKLAERIRNIIEFRKGAALILFTNVDHMRWCHEYVSSKVPYLCYVQGEASRAIMLEQFKTNVSSCLFATKTFFTGIDVPGKALSTLILTRAPFAVITEPMFRARADKIEERGESSFHLLSIPMMLFDVGQGFGRLIRTVSDTGFFAFLDSRALRKSYGRTIKRSLPDMKIIDQIDGVVTIETPKVRAASRLLDLEED